MLIRGQMLLPQANQSVLISATCLSGRQVRGLYFFVSFRVNSWPPILPQANQSVPIREIRGLPFICRRQIPVFFVFFRGHSWPYPFAAGKQIRGENSAVGCIALILQKFSLWLSAISK